ncbi:MAG: hypothetical protein ISS50_00115 [Anaerolineae bacterium]|nr:hypothetical protein [Anaerolineae bacterium]
MRGKLLRGTVWVVIALLILTGCTTLDVSTIIRADGSGTRRVAVALDENLYNLTLARGEDPFADIKAEAREIGARVEPYRREGRVGIAVAIDFPNLETLNQALGTEDFETLRVEKSGWPFKQTFTFRSQIDTAGVPKPEDIELGAVTRPDFIYSVTLPGEIMSHNATEVQGNKLTWYLNPLENTVYDLVATSEVVNQGLVTAAIVGGVVLGAVVILGGLILFGIMLRR